MAYTLIETVTVGSGGAASIEFTGIPQEAGADLVIVCSMRVVDNDNGKILFNGDTSTAYTTTRLLGTGSAVSSTVSTSESLFFMGLTDQNYTANTFGSAEILISNYTSSTNKSVSINAVTENNATFARQELGAGVYTTSSPITSLTLKANTTNTLEHSTASLYLVTTADASGATGGAAFPKATGGTISLAGGYWTHTFTGSGTFTPTEALTSDFLIVAGGGGACGGSGEGQGGGGAGGYRAFTSQSLAASAYSITVGAGGAAGNANADGLAPNGADSSAFSYTSTGGGGASGAYRAEQAGVPSSGGSGAGGGGFRNKTGAAGIAGQGNAGGSSGGGNQYGAGGGGGAGAVGGNGVNATGGGGGNGLTWLNGTTYAGGGGAQGGSATSGGTGGGGNGGSQTSQGGSGSANTGGGGGGSGGGFTGGAGGSGVVIVRYAA